MSRNYRKNIKSSLPAFIYVAAMLKYDLVKRHFGVLVLFPKKSVVKRLRRN